MISAYTNYIRKFDYYQILNSEELTDANDKAVLLDQIRGYVGFSENSNSDSEDNLKHCHNEYAECIVSDHCLVNPINEEKNAYCRAHKVQDESCKDILRQECDKNSSHSLCSEEIKNQKCSERVSSFCLLNRDNPICYRFSNRCLVNYNSCIGSENVREIFDINSVVNFDAIMDQNKETPLSTCLKDPDKFFKFEKKMIVHKLSEETPKYKNGYIQTFSIAGNFSIGSQLSWASHTSYNLSFKGTGATAAEAGVNPLNNLGQSRLRSGRNNSNGAINPGLKAGVGLGVDLSNSMGSDESDSRRRNNEARVGEAIYLTVARSTIEIEVEKFQKCLVIKPRPNAFFSYIKDGLSELYDSQWKKEVEDQNFKKIFASRPGLMVCNPKEDNNPENIIESYYYVSQLADKNRVELIDLYDLANRPYINILRGRREFVKFYSLLKDSVSQENGKVSGNNSTTSPPESLFVKYPHVVEKVVGLSLLIREFSSTGFYDGVYDYPEKSDEELDLEHLKQEEPSGFVSTFEFLRDNIRVISRNPLPSQNQISIQN